MVVATANYRVGPLGYLYLPQIGADNLGAQDQAAVLRWVRDNIVSFGGDPRAMAAGGQSALSLAFDPATGGLVRRVLLQSGPWGLPPQNPEQAAEEHQRLLDVPSTADPGQALCALPVGRLLSAYGELAARLARPGNAAPPMYPVLGGVGIPQAWQQAMANGALEGKDLLIGTTRDEMTTFFAFEPRIQSLTRESALQLLAGQFGPSAQDVFQRHANALPHVRQLPRQPDVGDPLGHRAGTGAVLRHGCRRIRRHRLRERLASVRACGHRKNPTLRLKVTLADRFTDWNEWLRPLPLTLGVLLLLVFIVMPDAGSVAPGRSAWSGKRHHNDSAVGRTRPVRLTPVRMGVTSMSEICGKAPTVAVRNA
ncbi:para-nitrobenzyl esterase [Streptomyces olivochromogenes]|uniref:Para-nitrobenzyl esterase n=1 Tax=Streptomyces olivochromogenes TaxID=1963 RepID=A0A250VTF0_STROL|nr:para-nitrobenzyl esterase [Streptomyces olivochromogenes]